MGRPRTFDEQRAVDAAAELFARHGYEGTSVDDLVTAVGVHRGSLYKVFGSKRGLYLAALRRPVDVPALQVHAGRDGLLRRDLADADGAALARDFRFEVIDDAGHFLPEEAPDAVTDLLLDWLPRVVQG